MKEKLTNKKPLNRKNQKVKGVAILGNEKDIADIAISKVKSDCVESTIRVSKKTILLYETVTLPTIQQKCEMGDRWALELSTKSYMQLVDKENLKLVDLQGLDITINCKEDLSRLAGELTSRYLNVANLPASEVKEIIKLLSSISINETVKESLLAGLTDEQVNNFATQLRLIK